MFRNNVFQRLSNTGPEDVVSDTEKWILVRGGFNVWRLEWVIPRLQREMDPVNGCEGGAVLNTGFTAKFKRPGYEGSIYNIMFPSVPSIKE